MKTLIVGGIRPDFINLSLLINELDNIYGKENVIFCHTGQHYDFNLDEIFFNQLGLRKPDYHFGVDKELTSTQQICKTIQQVETVIHKEEPHLAISFSDGNPSMFAVAANRLNVKVMHLEAGMRSYDYRMPEEKNRRIVDSISDYLFAPSLLAVNNLVSEGLGKRTIHVGKTILDVIEHFQKQIDDCGYQNDKDSFFLAEFHRPENVENETNLRSIMKVLDEIAAIYKKPIVFPIHPRTMNAIDRFGIQTNNDIEPHEPVGFFEFEGLQKNAHAVITDSGTSQEVCCYHHIPCMVMRMSTERQECIDVGSSILCGRPDGTFDVDECLGDFNRLLDRSHDWRVPYKPHATKDIIQFIRENEDVIMKKKLWWNSQ